MYREKEREREQIYYIKMDTTKYVPSEHISGHMKRDTGKYVS